MVDIGFSAFYRVEIILQTVGLTGSFIFIHKILPAIKQVFYNGTSKVNMADKFLNNETYPGHLFFYSWRFV